MTEHIAVHSLRLACVSGEKLASILQEYRGRILGLLAYSEIEPELPKGGFPCAWVALPVIGDDAWYEVWISARPVTVKGGVPLCLACDGDMLFGSITIPDAGAGALESMARSAYSAIFDALDHEGYPSLLRAWNYFARINDEEEGLERYREFNIGRHEAFVDKGRTIGEDGIPAACALGTRQGDLVICFLAGKIPGITLENPRQTNAYRYPRDFGPRSPTFSRGVLAGNVLLVSGTASIVGSETAHPENISRQLDETLVNLRMVIDRARESGFTADDSLRLFLNVYLRHAEDHPGVRSRLDAEFGDTAHIAYLQADVCRADLLVEIEAFWMPDQ